MIYFDNAATTSTSPLCVECLKKYGCENFFNPSALYAPSVGVSRVIGNAREGFVKLLRGDGDLIFTASGTEADNMAVFGTKKPKSSKIIISASEHSAVYNSAAELKQRGYDVLVAPVNADGSLDLCEFEKLLNNDVSFVSVMHVNNETGAVNDLKTIGGILSKRAPNALFHSDGVQALGKVDINLRSFGVDYYSVSAHKIHGMKGVGALYVKRGSRINPIIFGGGQEKGLRSATENVAGIISFYEVLKETIAGFSEDSAKKRGLLCALREKLLKNIPDCQIVSPENSPHILAAAFAGIRGEVLMHSLEEFGIYIGIGSACSSKKGINRAKSLYKLKKSNEEGFVRFSVDASNTLDEVDCVVDKICEINRKLRGFGRV